MSADADFIRVMIGYTELVQGKRVGKMLNQWIITPLQPRSEHVHLGDIKRVAYKSKRLWVAFEAVKRGKKNTTVGIFFAMSPRPSTWRTTTGALTHFAIKSDPMAVMKMELTAHCQKASQRGIHIGMVASARSANAEVPTALANDED